MGLIAEGTTRYTVSDYRGTDALRLEKTLGIGPLMAALLCVRGYGDVEEARRFLSPDLARDWDNPQNIPDMDEAASRIAHAVQRKERILVFGDFDADGVTSSAVLAGALRRMGGDVEVVLPRRLTEGYGLSRASSMRAMEFHPDLIITVDNGIAAHDEVAWLVSQGVDVVVTDHHEPADAVPQGVPVVDPKGLEESPSRDLAGVGVAAKTVAAVGRILGYPDMWREYLDLVALGTIADQMPLYGENRSLVAAGIAQLEQGSHPAIQAYLDFDKKALPVTSEGLSFSLLPKINSAGRMGDAILAYQFLTASTREQADQLMLELNDTNTRRREVEAACAEEAFRLADATFAEGQRAVVLGSTDLHEGVKGIVAARIVSRYHVPSILFSIGEDGMAHGSGRSVGKVDLFSAVRACDDCLVQFGGHAAAVGVTCKAENIDLFRTRLLEELDKLPEDDFVGESQVDLTVSLDEVTLEAVDEIERLQPFGNGNRYPTFMFRKVFLESRRAVGKPANHFSCSVTDGITAIRAISFNPAQLEQLLACEGPVDVIASPQVNEFRGRREVQLKLIEVVGPAPETSLSGTLDEDALDEIAFLEELDARAEESLSRERYAHIAEAESFPTKVAGVTFEGRQELLARLKGGEALQLLREPDNAYDTFAIAVVGPLGQIGYLNAELSSKLAPVMDGGVAYDARLEQVTGGVDGQSLGANIRVMRADAAQVIQQHLDELSRTRATWDQVAGPELDRQITHALIGDHEPHAAQAQALQLLSQGKNLLCVMATGRGKSFIFQSHAIRTALQGGGISIFVYPLRALVNDQAFHLEDVFANFGLGVTVLNGETSLERREEVYQQLSAGMMHCLLTTPEYLTLHADEIARCGRVGFLAIDEAHHVAGSRSAYGNLHSALEVLGRPSVLAVTATAGPEVARAIISELAITEVVTDDTVRENLRLVDRREVQKRDMVLSRIVAEGDKTIIYVNSRESTIRLARILRHAVPALSGKVAFYNAGLERDIRRRIETDLRGGRLRCVVATSAFGEGIDIPDVRNVVLYHLPFSHIDFNQMAGRCGRDGQVAQVHLLFNGRDAKINENIIAGMSPDRAELVTLWKALQRLAQQSDENQIQATNAQIAEVCNTIDGIHAPSEAGVSTGIAIFRELGLLRTSGFSSARRIYLPDHPGKVNLEASTRYLEGLGQGDEFDRFRNWAFSATPDELLGAFNHPILPR